MEKKENNVLVVVLMGIIIVIFLVLCILFATGKLMFNSGDREKTNVNEKDNTTVVEKDNGEDKQDSSTKEEKNYDSFIGKWRNEETNDEITIKSLTNNEITFTWAVYRLASIDDATIPFKDGEAIFYYQGYNDKNYDNKNTEDEKYIRRATIELVDSGVNVIVEDVSSIDSAYKLLNFDGSEYIKSGTYTHPSK